MLRVGRVVRGRCHLLAMGRLWLGGRGGGQAPRGSLEVVIAPVQACRLSLGWWGELLEPAVLLRGWGLLNQGPGEASAPLESGGLCRGLRPPLPAASVPGSPAGRCLWPSAPGARGGTNGAGPGSHGAQTWNTCSPQVPQGSISPHFMSSACLLGKT